ERDRPLYVMRSPVRVFEQSDLSWKEVPSQNPNREAARVIKLTDSYTFETVFEPNLKEWTELIPGYMHIRFETDSLVSERSDPDDDIIDRTDRYYVYLKPHGADDDAIRKQMKIRGNPPVYMPMPPHYGGTRKLISMSCAPPPDGRGCGGPPATPRSCWLRPGGAEAPSKLYPGPLERRRPYAFQRPAGRKGRPFRTPRPRRDMARRQAPLERGHGRFRRWRRTAAAVAGARQRGSAGRACSLGVAGE